MNAIKKYRKRLGMKQGELAAALGVSQTAVCMWETENRTPDTESLRKLRELFGCTADEILGFEDVPDAECAPKRLSFPDDKLIITAPNNGDIQIRVSRRANALIEEVAKLSGQSKSYVASRMIEFAYERTEIKAEEV